MSKANPVVLVKFKWGKAPYQAGEVAGFPPAVAERYIEAGIAVPAKAPKKPKKETKERKRPKLSKEMVAAARASGQGGDYITKNDE